MLAGHSRFPIVLGIVSLRIFLQSMPVPLSLGTKLVQIAMFEQIPLQQDVRVRKSSRFVASLTSIRTIPISTSGRLRTGPISRKQLPCATCPTANSCHGHCNRNHNATHDYHHPPQSLPSLRATYLGLHTTSSGVILDSIHTITIECKRFRYTYR